MSSDPFENPFDDRMSIDLQDPVDVLTAVPYLLGFAPSRSVVVLAVTDEVIDIGLRLDLPDPDQVALHAGRVARALRRVSAEQLILIGYGPLDAVTPVLTALTDALPWPVTWQLAVDGQRWWHLTDDEQDHVGDGQALVPNEIVATSLLVSHGAPAASRQECAAALAPRPGHVLDAVLAHLDTRPSTRIDTAPPTSATHHPTDRGEGDQPRTADELRALHEALAAAVRTRREHRVPLDVREAAGLLQAIADTRVQLACVGWRSTGAINLWRDLLPMAPPGWVAPVAAVLAWNAFLSGDGELAQLAAERAIQDDPGCLPVLALTEVVNSGLAPAQAADLLDTALALHPVLTAWRPPSDDDPARPTTSAHDDPRNRRPDHG